MSQFCGNCGAQLQENAETCWNCGAQTTAPKKKQSLPRRIGKVLLIALCVLLALVVVLAAALFGYSKYESYVYRRDHASSTTETESKVTTAEDVITFSLTDSDEPLTLDTYQEATSYNNRTIIYDNDYLYLVLDYDTVSREQLYAVIDGNSNISDQYKALIREYVDLVLAKYPDAELRPLYENLKTLKVVEGDNALLMASLSTDSYGCYRRDENTIYVKENFTYEPHTWAYQVVMHELSHCARTCWLNDDTVRIQISSTDYSCEILEEALNSLFAVHIFDYEELDIAYQLQSNMTQVMIDCMDNYDYDDFLKHSSSYYLSKLDEFNGNTNYAWSMMQLMEVQYNDYHDDSYELEQENYYLLYDYIAGMYYRTHITEGMTDAEKTAVAAELIEKIMYDVPEEYHIDTEEFYRALENY